MKIAVGTKSVLFGVHAFWWHPLTVFFAWLVIYRRLPTFPQLIGILLHDIGYWGRPDMDGPSGKQHPETGALAACWLVTKIYGEDAGHDAFIFTAYHSGSYAECHHHSPSMLCAPDKYSIIFEPRWFYLLRARLSGELREFRGNSDPRYTDAQWFRWLKKTFREKYGVSKKGQDF